MFIKSLQIGFMGLFLCVANAWAGPSSIQGVVTDIKGQPIKGADVRIESKDGKQAFATAKTDGKGRYISQGLQPGVYRVTLMVNGTVKAGRGRRLPLLTARGTDRAIFTLAIVLSKITP